jgi:hypothetical protein
MSFKSFTSVDIMLPGSRVSIKDTVQNFLSRCFLQNPSRDELAIKLIQTKQNAIHIREETLQMGRVAIETQDLVLSLKREKYDLKSRWIKTNRSLLRAQSRLSLHGALQYVKETIQDDDEIVNQRRSRVLFIEPKREIPGRTSL